MSIIPELLVGGNRRRLHAGKHIGGDMTVNPLEALSQEFARVQ